jgi:hypothetical protein
MDNQVVWVLGFPYDLEERVLKTGEYPLSEVGRKGVALTYTVLVKKGERDKFLKKTIEDLKKDPRLRKFKYEGTLEAEWIRRLKAVQGKPSLDIDTMFFILGAAIKYAQITNIKKSDSCVYDGYAIPNPKAESLGMEHYIGIVGSHDSLKGDVDTICKRVQGIFREKAKLAARR